MKINENGRKLIYSEEGVRLKAYKCSAGVWTISVGATYYPSTGKRVKEGDTISLVESDRIFNEIVKVYEEAVNRSIKVVLTQNQFNALVSLCFNIGAAAFATSTLVKKINAKAPIKEIEKQFLAWKNAAGKPILLGRRQREFKMYVS